MQITGKNLEWVAYALELAKAEIHNQIVTCPEPAKYQEDIADLNADKAKLTALLAKVNLSIERENERKPK